MLLCRWAIAHRIRFDEARTADALRTMGNPRGCVSWKFGPDVPASARANRSGSHVWCGIASFADRAAAQAAFESPQAYVPGLSDASEAWQALLVPTLHRGECNHLDPDSPGLMYEPSAVDPSGPLVVVTTAGFDLLSKSDFQRLIHFRRRVDRMRDVIATAEGSIAHQVFAPSTAGDDAVTMSVWRDERSMLKFAYQPGSHRGEVDRQLSHRTVDRSSFTRFRVVTAAGRWEGIDLLSASLVGPNPPHAGFAPAGRSTELLPASASGAVPSH